MELMEAVYKAVEFPAHNGHPVNQCCYAFNDSAAVTCSDDGTVCFWEINSCRNILTLSDLHDSPVKAINVNEQLQQLFSVSWDKCAVLNNFNTEHMIFRFPHESLCTSCHVNKVDNIGVVGCDNGAVYLWDLRSGEGIANTKGIGHSSTVMDCQFSHNGLSLCSTSMDRSAIIWDIREMKPLLKLSGHMNAVSCCSFSPDDRHLATASWDKTTRIYDVAIGTYRSKGETVFKGHEGCVSGCEFSSDGSLIVSCGYDSLVAMYNTRSGGKVCSLKGHDNWIEDIHISSDNRWLLTCAKDGVVKVWDTESKELSHKKAAVGLEMSKCELCGRMFTDVPIPDSLSGLCVFCRINSPQRSLEHILAPLR